MALAKLTYLDTNEVSSIAEPILAVKLKSYGFSKLNVEELRDFDGEYIFRLHANVERQVPAIEVIEASDAINRMLRSQGELRFVNLSTEFRQSDAEEDGDED
jgi:hypothetical protein